MAKVMADVLLQAYPGAARPPNEVVQAEALYNPSSPSRGVLKVSSPCYRTDSSSPHLLLPPACTRATTSARVVRATPRETPGSVLCR
jgi:hypothetical protein